MMFFTKEAAKQYPWIIAKRDHTIAESAYLRQIGPAFRVGRSHPYIVCECRGCGGFAAADEAGVRSGRLASCGCRRKIHGRTVTNRLASSGPDRTYNQWRILRQRHRDGIPVQSEWLEKSHGAGLAALVKDVGECPPDMVLREIVRGGGYVRGNVRWAEPATNGKHRRQTTSGQQLYAATARCPHCASYSTRTLTTVPQSGIRYHVCMETECKRRFKTQMAELIALELPMQRQGLPERQERTAKRTKTTAARAAVRGAKSRTAGPPEGL